MNVENLFAREYKRVAQLHNGGFVPAEAAMGLAQEIGRPDLEKTILGILSHPRFEEALYPDVSGFLEMLQGVENTAVTIWTQGEAVSLLGGHGYQIAKVARSRISDGLGQSWRKQERMTNIPRVVAGFDKVQILPDLMKRITEWSPEHIVVVDDKPENLLQAASLLSSLKCSASYYCISRYGADTRIPVSEIPYLSITSLEELSHVVGDGQKRAWILDLDYTLLDHEKVKNTLQQQVKELVEMTI